MVFFLQLLELRRYSAFIFWKKERVQGGLGIIAINELGLKEQRL